MIEALAILAAGFWAGMINVVVGSGTLVTFPTLLFFGYPPLVANISNNIGLVGGGITGTLGYRRELAEHAPALRRLLPASLAGGLTGALLLLVLPDEAFRMIVPALIGLGLVMVVWGPRLQRTLQQHKPSAGTSHAALLTAGVYVLGIYGGYFGAAQGVLLVGWMSVLTVTSLQSITALKNLLTTGVNAIAAVTFVIVARDSVDWTAVALIAAGATLGGVAGARFGRMLPPIVMRTLIVVIGLIAIGKLALFP
ncbi:putative membrane protein YfcA [Catenuloplanes nepalensis]|uniref:Probable membrane transporter protein n=1 Tax=Catenuloplanes nepalensis TaxID=587533 RepID=A0ABT9MSG1_9ACTN|nr:sulfite exporter TauE/SafE family protein [Catenuloplanes nepalensis]MDP9794375.1 putative membrane protein YfcA [Catenuloplanes nepalensis]